MISQDAIEIVAFRDAARLLVGKTQSRERTVVLPAGDRADR